MLPLDFTYELIFLRIDVLTYSNLSFTIFFIFIVVDDVIIRGQLSK